MNCEDIKIFMVEYIYDEISSKNQVILKKHLQNCIDCAAEFSDLQKTSDKLKMWKEEKLETLHVPIQTKKPKSRKRIFYRIFAVAASLLFILSLMNFRFSLDTNGFALSFSLFGIANDTDQIASNILQNGSQVEQIQLMNEMIIASNEQQKQEMVELLTDFYQAIEMRRQADLKVISQNVETIRSFSNQRIEETERNMEELIQYTGSILDKGNFIKAIDAK
jgi:hypothetical protein